MMFYRLVHQARILIKDDNEGDSLALQEMLTDGGFCCIRTIRNAECVQQRISEFHPDVLILDLRMLNGNGCSLTHQPYRNESAKAIPVIAVLKRSDCREISQAYEMGAFDYISKPFLPLVVLKRIERSLFHIMAEPLQTDDVLSGKLMSERKKALGEEEDEFSRLLRIIECRNIETGLHICRIGLYVHQLAQLKGFSPEYAGLLKYASMLHDIGKIAIPDSILLKPGSLSVSETLHMRCHTAIGAKILSGSNREVIRMAEVIALTHHERWDGKGYPLQLCGEAIPIGGRITSICDVYDALLSKRPYKEAWGQEKARNEIVGLRGKAFDPELVDLFFANEQSFISINEYKSIDDLPD